MNVTRGRIAIAVVVVAVIGVAVFAPGVVRRLAFFRVRQVELVGARYLDETDVTQRLGLRPEASVLDRLTAVRLAAAAIPGVVDAVVERRLPGTLRIVVREAVPVAMTDASDRLSLMDAGGHILPFDPTRVPASYPIAVHDAGVAALLGRLMQIDSNLYSGVEFARLERGDVVLDVGAHRIRLRPEADNDVLHAVIGVIIFLNQSAIEWREIDARYRNRVFVQKGTA